MRLLTILLAIISFRISAQQDILIDNIEAQYDSYQNRLLEERKLEVGYSVGFMFDLSQRSNGSLRAYANIGILQKITRGDFHVLLGGQSHIEFYRGGLGTSLLNSEKFKINIELRNSFMVLTGIESNNHIVGKPAFVGVGSDASSLLDPLDYSVSLGTIFINGINHGRHQRIGTYSGSANQATFHYYNDGPPSDFFMTGDKFDRYWTGGGQLGLYFKNNTSFLTDLILRYDNYTGYQLNLYEVGSMLKIDNLPYLKKEQQMFNQARFQYKIGIQNSIFLNGSVFEPVITDIQHLIHYNISFSPFHARPLGRRITFGLEYNYQFKFQ